MMSPIRRNRLEHLLQQLVASLILKGVVKDHRVNSDILVREVKIANDFSHAKIYVSTFKEKQLTQAVEALNHASGFIRRQIAPQLRTRHIPNLTFYGDDSIKKGSSLRFKMEQDLQLSNKDEESEPRLSVD